ncbi:hypothetical protein SpCBS45565_g04892 [Spizellomyces sp. 'palustris']|nr:hypothetical protein SpCBS45565_g04892 [Spizellomyces sp. 'palustris']
MASRLYPTVQMSKDIFLALHSEGQADFFQAILFGVREMCDDEEVVVHVKGFVPFHASGNDLVPALSQLLSLHGQTVLGWFASFQAAPFRRDFGSTVNSLSHISQDMATIYFEVFQRALFRTFLLNWKKELSSEASGGTSDFVDEASVILKDLVGLVCVRGSPLAGSSAILSYQSPSINTDQLITELAGSSGQFPFLSAEAASGFPELKDIEKLHESLIRDTVAENVKGNLNGAEVLATLAHPPPLHDTNSGTATRKRKSTADIQIGKGNKKVKTDFKLAQEIRRIPDENIQVFPGQRSDFLRRVNSAHSMIFCSPFDELSFSSLLPSDPTAERMTEFSELTPNLISKYDAMSTYMTTTVATKMERYQETCKKYNVLLRCLDSLNRINREDIRKAVLKEGTEGNEVADDADVAVPMEGVEQSENAAEVEIMREANDGVHLVQREREGDELVVTNGAMPDAPSSMMSPHETPARNDEKAQQPSKEEASSTDTVTQPMDISAGVGRESSLSDNVATEAENAAKKRELSPTPSVEIEASVSDKRLGLDSPTGHDSDEVERRMQAATIEQEIKLTTTREIEPQDRPVNVSIGKAEVNEEEKINRSISPEEEPPTPNERAPVEAKRDVTPASPEKPEIPSEPKTDDTEEMEEAPRAVEKLTAEPFAEIETPPKEKPAPRRIGLQEYLRQKGKLPAVTSTSTESTPPSLEDGCEDEVQQDADVPSEIPKPQTPELGQTPSDRKDREDRLIGSGEEQEHKNDQPKETGRSPQYATREQTPVTRVKQTPDSSEPDHNQSNQDAGGNSSLDSSVSEPAKHAKGTVRRDIGSEASKTATVETVASPHRSTSSRVSSRSSSIDGRQQSTSRSAPASTVTSDKDDVEEGEVSDSMDRRSSSSGRHDRTRRSGYFGSTPLYTSLYGDRPSREPSSPVVASRRLERDGSRGWSPLSSGGRDRERDRDRAGSKERERHWDGRERERDRGDREGSFNSYRPGSGTWDRDRDRERYSFSRERDRDSYQPERERTERDSYQPDRERTERDSYQPERDRDRGERDSYQPDRDRDRERTERERFGGDSYHPSRDSGSSVSSWRPRDGRPR